MKRREFTKLRNEMLKAVGILGTKAELEEHNTAQAMLAVAYSNACIMLDKIDEVGVFLGYLDPETNNEL